MDDQDYEHSTHSIPSLLCYDLTFFRSVDDTLVAEAPDPVFDSGDESSPVTEVQIKDLLALQHHQQGAHIEGLLMRQFSDTVAHGDILQRMTSTLMTTVTGPGIMELKMTLSLL
jgi:hypothetical protein